MEKELKGQEKELSDDITSLNKKVRMYATLEEECVRLILLTDEVSREAICRSSVAVK